MATPFPNVPVDDPKDNYNFYHSQLRICIECAFGMLVNRWGILRKPLSAHYTINKVTSLVDCLCRMHNFLIDRGVSEQGFLNPTDNDELDLSIGGAVLMTQKEVNMEVVFIPDSLIRTQNGTAEEKNSQS